MRTLTSPLHQTGEAGFCMSKKGSTRMAQTLAEQILSNATGRPVQAGENVVVNVDLAMMHDSISPSIIKVLHGELGAERVWDADRIAVVIDTWRPQRRFRTPSIRRTCGAGSASRASRISTMLAAGSRTRCWSKKAWRAPVC